MKKKSFCTFRDIQLFSLSLTFLDMRISKLSLKEGAISGLNLILQLPALNCRVDGVIGRAESRSNIYTKRALISREMVVKNHGNIFSKYMVEI